jgi:hypothetical protein
MVVPRNTAHMTPEIQQPSQIETMHNLDALRHAACDAVLDVMASSRHSRRKIQKARSAMQEWKTACDKAGVPVPVYWWTNYAGA